MTASLNNELIITCSAKGYPQPQTKLIKLNRDSKLIGRLCRQAIGRSLI